MAVNNFTPAGNGGMTLIATATPSAATTVQFASIPATYKQLQLVWRNVYSPTSVVGAFWYVRLNNDSGANYYYSGNNISGTSANYGSRSTVSGFGQGGQLESIIFNENTVSTDYHNQSYGVMNFYRADQTEKHSVNWQTTNYPGTTTRATGFFSGYYNGTSAAITQIDFIRSSTQTITGTFYLYGIN